MHLRFKIVGDFFFFGGVALTHALKSYTTPKCKRIEVKVVPLFLVFPGFDHEITFYLANCFHLLFKEQWFSCFN